MGWGERKSASTKISGCGGTGCCTCRNGPQPIDNFMYEVLVKQNRIGNTAVAEQRRIRHAYTCDTWWRNGGRRCASAGGCWTNIRAGGGRGGGAGDCRSRIALQRSRYFVGRRAPQMRGVASGLCSHCARAHRDCRLHCPCTAIDAAECATFRALEGRISIAVRDLPAHSVTSPLQRNGRLPHACHPLRPKHVSCLFHFRSKPNACIKSSISLCSYARH